MSIVAVKPLIAQIIDITLLGMKTKGVVSIDRVDALCLSGRMARI